MEQTGGDLVAFGQKLPKSLVQQGGGRLYGSLVRGIPPALDVDAGFPAPFTGGSGRDLATQQGSSDVLCPAHRDACQRFIVHINGKKYSRISAFFVIVRGWTTVFFLC